MPLLSKRDYSDLYKHDEYKTEGCWFTLGRIILIIGILVFIWILAGCTKETDEAAVNFNGYYSGELAFTYEETPVVYHVNRAIRGDSSTWYTSPLVVSEFKAEGNTYPITYIIDKAGICSNVAYRHLWNYTGTGTLRNDTLFETGTYDYKYFSEGKQYIHLTGTWTGWYSRIEIWR